MLTWDKIDERYYEQGLDRGVLYIPGLDPVPWNGLTGFDEGSDSGAAIVLYRDGVAYLSDVDASDFRGSLGAIFFPDEFHPCIGIPEVTDGLYVDGQKPKRFSFSYRTLIGSGTEGDLFAHQVHLVYNAMASISPRARKTMGSDNAPTEFTFDLVCTPVKLAGYRPTAHYIIDTRSMSDDVVSDLEDLLYGTGSTPGRMPTPEELFDIMDFGDNITVNVQRNTTDPKDGNFTVKASHKNVSSIDPWHFRMDNINGTDNGDGTYVISDGGTTDVILE